MDSDPLAKMRPPRHGPVRGWSCDLALATRILARGSGFAAIAAGADGVTIYHWRRNISWSYRETDTALKDLFNLISSMGGCVGGLLKFQSASIRRTLNIESKRNLGPLSFSGKKPWSSSQDEMDTIGAITWNQIRGKWIGNQSHKQEKEPREPVISWSTTYDDLLTDTQPFSEPIPLPEMVDFLVDTWHEEGLYD
ncbi:hypothetical protein H6P81_017697 [Aristolochia fimbriata]|uniref:Gag1-like clamp domain-containing protein n=1 Tax=Aristolochia fimbriata TaxID=158543 RepID=A0AAV7E369_ARIFI|nr:hypothetical protein H6P81_017697 [Aristolochia fimbriata]